jgi:uncharacterized membrane protein YhfC
MVENWGLLIADIAAIIVEIGLPVTLAVLIIKKWKVSWLVVLTGVLAFIGSQVVHIPLLQVPALLQKLGLSITLPQEWPIVWYAVFLGFMAGICEETARWVGYKILKGKAANYKSAFAAGIGHGGVESLLVGLLVLVNLVFFLTFNPDAMLASGTPEGAVAMTISQAAQFWASPWHLALAGAFERVIAISAHLFMSVLVWKSVRQKSWLWFLAAVVFHALLDFCAVYFNSLGLTPWQLELSITAFLVADVIFLVLFWKKEKQKEAAAALAAEPAA